MPKQGSDFEKLVEMVIQKLPHHPGDKIERNVMVVGPDGTREVDILITGEYYGVPIITIIECKDYNKKVNIAQFDGFASKKDDLKAQVGIFVSGKGFSNQVKNKARRLGIQLLTIQQANSPKRGIDFKIPCLVNKIKNISFRVEFRSEQFKGFTNNNAIPIINGVNLEEYIKNKVKNKEYDNLFLEAKETATLDLKDISRDGKFYIQDPENSNEIEISELELILKIKVGFGILDLDLLEDTSVIKDIINDKSNIYFSMDRIVEEVINDRVKFYDSLEYFDQSEKLTIWIRPSLNNITSGEKSFGFMEDTTNNPNT